MEAIFLRAFRSFEAFIRDVFLLYCLERPTRSGRRVRSFLNPRSFRHAEELIQSSLRYLDWTSPDQVIRRADLYLHNGFPLKIPYASKKETLQDFKHIRNYIAHSSKEALASYQNVLRKHFGAIPLSLPAPGEFLLAPDPADPYRYMLLAFFDTIETIADQVTR